MRSLKTFSFDFQGMSRIRLAFFKAPINSGSFELIMTLTGSCENVLCIDLFSTDFILEMTQEVLDHKYEKE